jgi:hypothetical protein
LKNQKISLNRNNIQGLFSKKEDGNEDRNVENAKRLVGIVDGLRMPLSELEPLKEALNRKCPEAQKLTDTLKPAIITGQSKLLESKTNSINMTLCQVEKILRDQHSIMASREMLGTAKIFEQSLRDIGYNNLQRKTTRDGRQIIRSSNSKTSIFVEISDRGIQTDTMGFSGYECKKVMNQLNESLEKNGLKTKKIEYFHGKEEGGELVKEYAPLFNPLTFSISSPAHEDKRRKRNGYMMKKLVPERC